MSEKSGNDSFKEVFKFYKRRDKPLDISSVIEFNETSKWSDRIQTLEASSTPDPGDEHVDLIKYSDWKIYKLLPEPDSTAGDGIYYIKNPFSDIGHLRWSLRCLKEYTESPPFKTNLDPFVEQIRKDLKSETKGLTEEEESINQSKKLKSEKQFSWWENVQTGKSSSLIDKLRWSTLGYHHDWDTKVYSDDKVSKFPEELSDLSKRILKRVKGFESLAYNPEAAIVNFYPMDSSIGGHTDHSEPNKTAPLVSISFGQSAIFLIGGKDKSVKPVPLLLNSGDVLVMTNDARQSYHAVPRIVESTSVLSSNNVKVANIIDAETSQIDLKFTEYYLSNHRINVNIRQVY